MTFAPLVSTAWLAEHTDDASLVILDASWFMPGSPRDPAAEYAAAHIPGAVRFDIDAISEHSSDLPHMMATASDFATAVRRLGVEPQSLVVVYDATGVFSAPRVWWNFRAMGHERVAVLDGGLPKWVAEGRPVETGWREPSHGEFKAHADPQVVADLMGVRQSLTDANVQVVDARPALRFAGKAPEPREGVRGGHMPGAINVPWDAVIENGVMRTADSLREVFSGAGVDLSRPIITTCGSGISASVLALALAVLGRGDVAVYDGSWTEWGSRTDTPVVTDA